jgi:hypothetical protein
LLFEFTKKITFVFKKCTNNYASSSKKLWL